MEYIIEQMQPIIISAASTSYFQIISGPLYNNDSLIVEICIAIARTAFKTLGVENPKLRELLNIQYV